jgi:acyl carrier protein
VSGAAETAEEAVLRRVLRVIARQCPGALADGVGTPATSLLEDLCLDSVEVIKLMIGLEREFGLSLEDEDIGGLETLGDAVALLIARLGDAPPPRPGRSLVERLLAGVARLLGRRARPARGCA